MDSQSYKEQLRHKHAAPRANVRGTEKCPACNQGVVTYSVVDRGDKINIKFSCDVCVLSS